MNYAALKQAHADWLATNPDPATDAAFLAWLAEQQTVIVPYLANERTIAFAVTQATGDPAAAEAALQGIETAAESNAVVARALKWIVPESGGVDMGNTIVRQMVADLATAGAITTTARDAMLAIAEQTQTRAQTLGLGVVAQPHIDRLRLDGGIE